MGLFKHSTPDSSETKGLQVHVNHKLIDQDQANIFTATVKETVKIIVVASVLTVLAAVTLKSGAEVAVHNLTK
jgi:hypothetical protein